MPSADGHLAQVVAAQGEEIAKCMQKHRTQTNEVARSPFMLPALPVEPLSPHRKNMPSPFTTRPPTAWQSPSTLAT